ncbi:MAG: hypothetical protein A2Y25_11905 [Candidatus Melainabacteria bacterium GWF2_37_15]|nr:MAG: hypothetical protein A2Y25_11905 [Candidatus Melainabacteria bacterium GWF2_37_15]
MTDKPLITVVTVTYNAEKCLEDTIKSVISQTYPNIEYIIIDGSSTDKTVAIIKKYQDKVSHWISEPDKGIFYAMNKGIDLANGEWISFMNAGDCFYDNEVISKVFKDNPTEDFIYGNTKVVYQIGKYKLNKFISPPDLKDLWKRTINHQSIFTKTSIMKSNKFIPNSPSPDSELLLKAYYKNNCTFKKVNITIARYLGGGFSSINPYEKPLFIKYFKRRYNRWKLVKSYLNEFKVDAHYSFIITRDLLQILILKFLPDYIRYKLFYLINRGVK